MEQKRIKVRLTKNSPYSDYGYYEKGDIGYIDGYVNDNAVIILENGKFAKADLRWIEVVNEEDKNVNTELKWSEDGRISKHLLYHFRNKTKKEWNGMPVKDIIAWLEEQEQHKKFRDSIQVNDKVTKNEDGVLVNLSQLKRVAKKDEQILANSAKTCKDEQKPAWSKEDETVLDNLIYALANDRIGNDRDEYVEWLKSLKDRAFPQQQEWSEEDDRNIDWLITVCERIHYKSDPQVSPKCALMLRDWLKSIKERYTWKPSDVQINCLSKHIEYERRWNSSHALNVLSELLEQLKKLKDEK